MIKHMTRCVVLCLMLLAGCGFKDDVEVVLYEHNITFADAIQIEQFQESIRYNKILSDARKIFGKNAVESFLYTEWDTDTNIMRIWIAAELVKPVSQEDMAEISDLVDSWIKTHLTEVQMLTRLQEAICLIDDINEAVIGVEKRQGALDIVTVRITAARPITETDRDKISNIIKPDINRGILLEINEL